MPHIPSGNTILLDLIRFDDALAAAQRPSPNYDYQKWLYVPNVYSEYRYILGTRGKKPLICVGINPSTAAPDHLDNTLKSVERVALHNGYDSFIMFNVYAQRATDPDDMEQVYNQESAPGKSEGLRLRPLPGPDRIPCGLVRLGRRYRKAGLPPHLRPRYDRHWHRLSR